MTADLAQLRAQARYLLDRRAILDCIYRYCRGLDRLDAETLAASFHPDAQDVHGGWVGYAPDLVSWGIELVAKSIMSSHHITGHRCEIDGDVAHAESYILSYGRRADGGVTSFCGRYLDRFEKTDGTWRFARRKIVAVSLGDMTAHVIGAT